MGKGGARWGAGRPGYRGKAEGLIRLDVRQMARSGRLSPGTESTLSWSISSTGQHAGTIGYRVDGDVLVLSYSLSGTPRVQHVPILRTACTYGGSRPWFQCPHCAGRVAVLFCRRGGFYCRRCAQVAYSSQSEDECARAWRSQHKIEARLGPDGSKPKGMHEATYARLLASIDECEGRRELALMHYMLRAGIFE